MTTFDERAHAYEAQLAHEEELEFKVIARRNKLLGLWAANRLHIPEPEVEKYALQVVENYVDKASDEDLLKKILADFQKAEIEMTVEELEDQLFRFFDLAQEQILNK
jgi:hypothetical protein